MEMRKQRIGTITLAITLISFGILLLLNNITDVKVLTVLSILWPLIIVIFGLEIVLSKFIFEKRDGETKAVIDGLSLTLLIIIVILSSVVTSIGNWSPGVRISLPFNGNGFNIFSQISGFYEYSSTFKKEIVLEADNHQRLEMDNSYGSIEIQGTDGNDIIIEAEIRIKHNDEKYANTVSEKIIKTENTGDVIRIISDNSLYKQERDKIGNITIDYYIKVPNGMELELENRYGNVDARNINNSIKIGNDHGNVLVRLIDGDLKLVNSYGQVEVIEISGKSVVENKHGNVFAKELGNNLDITNAYGDIEVEDIKGDVKIKNSHNQIDVQRVDKNLSIDSQYCNIRAMDIKGSIDVKGNNDNMYLEKIQGNVVANNRYGDIELKDANKGISMITRNGDIVLHTMEQIQEEVKIENEYGDILIEIPRKQEGSFNMLAAYGNIQNDFDFDINKSGNEESVNERIGENDIRFDIRNKNGEIRVRAY